MVVCTLTGNVVLVCLRLQQRSWRTAMWWCGPVPGIMRERAIAEPLSPSLSGDSITLEFIGLLWLSLTFGSTSCRSVDLMAYLSIKVLPETTLVNQCFFFLFFSLSLSLCLQAVGGSCTHCRVPGKDEAASDSWRRGGGWGSSTFPGVYSGCCAVW